MFDAVAVACIDLKVSQKNFYFCLVSGVVTGLVLTEGFLVALSNVG